jgi:hypothetical protein
VVIALNNPGNATDVLTYVPGTTAGLNGGLGKDVDRAGFMMADATQNNSSSKYSAIMWQGYDPPQTIPGHSYGTSVVGKAATLGLVADRVIFVASPGVMASSVDGFWLISKPESARIPVRERVWAITAPNDPILTAASINDHTWGLLFGGNPLNPDFGASDLHQ